MERSTAVSVIFQTQTERAVCVREEREGDDIWLPLSQIEFDDLADYERGERIELWGPEWLFESKGLI